jgi:membrane protein involved in colicin uptake
VVKKDDKERLDKLEISIIISIGVIVLLSIFAPIIFTTSWGTVDFTDTGQIGDTIGGIMTPIVAIAGVLVTFLAFYIQFKANKLQRELFRQELDEQIEQTKKTKFENQFYEMLRLHKENVNEISLNLKKEDFSGRIENTQIRGRDVFKYLVEEIKILYYVAKKNIHKRKPR